MIVALDKNLYYIKQYLENTGKYEVYEHESYIGPIHAHIYEQQTEEIFQDIQSNLINLAHNNHTDIRHGILMINAKNKTPREIERILSERLYKNIF